ncbi:MAG: tetratricopeptide repeat protein, partial [bacterium]|nr:tetratricopeptide repeat protein [bacterium]
ATSISEGQTMSQKLPNKAVVEKAIVKYTESINSNPNKEENYISRAYANYLLGNLDAAISDYNKLIQLNPKNEEFYLNRGYLKHIANKRQEALNDYDTALSIKPNYDFALNNRGVVLAELGRAEESMQAYDKAISINPNYADAYYNRGNLKTKTDKNEEALADFNTAIKLNPTDAASFNNRGVVKRKLNCNVGALSDFTIAIKLDPEDITAYANRGHLKKRYFDSEGAEEDFKSAIAIAEENPKLVKEIELEKEVAKYNKPQAVETTPIAYVDAPADLNLALRLPKVSEKTLQRLADKRYSINTNSVPEGTIQASVVKVDPKQNLGKNTQTTPVKPAPVIATKPVTNPDLAECYYIRGLQKYILQNRESALKDFNAAIQNNPNYAEAYYYRAAIKRDMKDDSFVDDYKKAISIDPNLKAVSDANVLNILKM